MKLFFQFGIALSLLIAFPPLFSFSPTIEEQPLTLAPPATLGSAVALNLPPSKDFCIFYFIKHKFTLTLLSLPLPEKRKFQITPSLAMPHVNNFVPPFSFASAPFFTYHHMEEELCSPLRVVASLPELSLSKVFISQTPLLAVFIEPLSSFRSYLSLHHAVSFSSRPPLYASVSFPPHIYAHLALSIPGRVSSPLLFTPSSTRVNLSFATAPLAPPTLSLDTTGSSKSFSLKLEEKGSRIVLFVPKTISLEVAYALPARSSLMEFYTTNKLLLAAAGQAQPRAFLATRPLPRPSPHRLKGKMTLPSLATAPLGSLKLSLDAPRSNKSFSLKLGERGSAMVLFVPNTISLEVAYALPTISSFPELEVLEKANTEAQLHRHLFSSHVLALQEESSSKKPKRTSLREEGNTSIEVHPTSLVSIQLPLPASRQPTFEASIAAKRLSLASGSLLECKAVLFPGLLFEEPKELSLTIAPLSSPFFYTSNIATQIASASSPESWVIAPTNYPSYPLPHLTITPHMHLPYGNTPFSFFADRRPMSSSLYLLEEARLLNRTHRFTQLNLLHIPNLEDLQTDSMGEEFKISVEVVPQMDHQGFLFSVNLTADNPAELDFAPHHIYFLLDPNSPSDNLESFKKAILYTIAQLSDTVCYNVILLDNALSQISDNDLYPGKASFNYTKKILARIKPSSTTSFTNLDDAVESIAQKAASSKEVYTAVLLSSGQFMKNLRSHQESLQHLIERAPSNFALYTTAISEKMNLPMLELVARLGRGELIYSATNIAFPRKCAASLQKLLQPIAYNLHLTKISPSTHTTLYHENRLTPMLYAGKTYTFYGSATKLEDLTFILQGESYGKWFHCTKRISLKNASKGSRYLEEELATQKALLHISEFLTTRDFSQLSEAKKLFAHTN